MDLEKIKDILKDEPKFRLKQVYQAIFSNFVEDWDEVSNLPKDLREKLKQEAPINIQAEVYESEDKKTVKALIDLGDNKVETVLMRHGDGRNTVCVSSQIGCPMRCDFCLTGQSGFKRSLNFHEIVLQVLFFSRYLKRQKSSRKEGERVSNIVFMGMGEPFLNYDEVMKAIKFLNDKETFNIGARRISISTVGIIEGINKLSSNPMQINLAISLHSPDEELRDKLIPANRSGSIDGLLKSVAEYIKKTNRKVMIEYIMLAGINDSDIYAQKLAKLLKEKLEKLFVVNLIPYNETKRYKTSSPERVKSFKEILEDEGLEVIERYRFGRDIRGACGQLMHNE